MCSHSCWPFDPLDETSRLPGANKEKIVHASLPTPTKVPQPRKDKNRPLEKRGGGQVFLFSPAPSTRMS